MREQQSALGVRKTLSAEIGKLMREKKEEEASQLKLKVEEANQVAAKAEEELVLVSREGLPGSGWGGASDKRVPAALLGPARSCSR